MEERNQLNTENMVVMLIDMQPYFLEGGFERDKYKPHISKVIESQKKVLQICVKNGIPIITLEYILRGETIPQLKRIIERNPNNRVFEKDDGNGFTNKNLRDYLETMGREYLFFMGVSANDCVQETAKDAHSKDYRIASSRDIITNIHSGKIGDEEQWYESNGIFTLSYKDFRIFSEEGVLA